MGNDGLSAEGAAEYTGAEEYDLENRWGADDDFYLSLAKSIGGPVLDAGCGTGRLTRAIAQAGLEVTGFDYSPEMLARAAMLAEREGLDIDWIQGDVRTMELGRKFQLILMTGHGFQHMISDGDIHAFCDRMAQHLVGGGYLAFETRNFKAKTFGGSEEPSAWRSFQDDAGRWVDVLVGSRYDPETRVERFTTERVVRETGERSREPESSLRYIEADELRAMLDRHGFDVLHQYGDWQRGPLGDDQPEIISICQLRSREER